MIQLVGLRVASMKRKFQSPLLAGAVVLGAVCSGAFLAPQHSFRTQPPIDSKRLASVLAGFSFTGEFDCPNLEVPTHGVEVRPFPTQFAASKCYVLHLPSTFQDSPSRLLILRLRENKFELKRYPRSTDDYVHLMMGGPLFRIDFRSDGRDGSILAVQGSHGTAGAAALWKLDDYVLFFKP
jgi:hypothetical protein